MNWIAGVTTTSFTLNILADVNAETDETIKVTLSNPSAGYVVGASSLATVTIIEDEPQSFTVSESTDEVYCEADNTLSWAISQANMNPASADTITINNMITLSHNNGLPPCAYIFGDTAIISEDGNNYTIYASNTSRPFVILGGTVTLTDLNIVGGLAKGGDSPGNGGGGAGMGGAAFVYDGHVTFEEVKFISNHAKGGDSLPGAM